ncbi:MAG: decaprenyl-phosphate phosphoribosyltransferase [Actinomycetota bacterium]|nr:decaprenyl-phosphate phosphoribosyltransferase [Actinomycetota bacterium]
MAEASERRGAAALLEAIRPRQWLKNLLVLAAPGAAGVLLEPVIAGRVGLCFAAFCLVASGGYLINDVCDAPADRCHPRKRVRPVADGRLRASAATVAGAALIAAGLAVGGLADWRVLATLGGYVALTLAYSAWLRRVPVLDLVTVAAFFVIRAVAGGIAAGVPLSKWFLIVVSFGSLFIVSAKRAGEHAALGADRGDTRPALVAYSLAYLRNVRTLSAGVAVTAYCLWAFDPAAMTGVQPLVGLSIVPFLVFVLRYAMLVEDDGGRPPEDLLLGDRGLQAAALAWVVVFAGSVAIGA